MSFDAISQVFPTDRTFNCTSNPEYFVCETDPLADIIDYIGSDCWGLYIKKLDGTIDYKFNAYALELDNSENKQQQDFEMEIQNFYSTLENYDNISDDIKIGDTIVVWMFNCNGYNVELKKIEKKKWSYQIFSK